MKKNKIIITGGAGFVGTNLINLLLKKTSHKIISIDNYSSGFKKNHIKNKRIHYIKGDTKDISFILKSKMWIFPSPLYGNVKRTNSSPYFWFP